MLADVASRLAQVRGAIDRAAEVAGRDPGEVLLVAVSKTHPAEAIAAAHAAGQRDFGENYVQEMVGKAGQLASLADLRWHAIGGLQRNKVKDVVRIAQVLHTVDRRELVEELGKRAAAAQRTVDVLVEVDVAGEVQKAGCDPAAVPELLRALEDAGPLRAVGLMAIPPAAEDPEAVRPHFRALRRLRDDLRSAGFPGLRELSMGMSGDFEVAIAEGATMVRVGTAIFGTRAQRA